MKYLFNKYSIGGITVLSLITAVYFWFNSKIEYYQNETNEWKNKYYALSVECEDTYSVMLKKVDSLQNIIMSFKKDTVIIIQEEEKKAFVSFSTKLSPGGMFTIRDYEDERIRAKFEMYAESPVKLIRFKYKLKPVKTSIPVRPRTEPIILNVQKPGNKKKWFVYGALSGALAVTATYYLIGR